MEFIIGSGINVNGTVDPSFKIDGHITNKDNPHEVGFDNLVGENPSYTRLESDGKFIKNLGVKTLEGLKAYKENGLYQVRINGSEFGEVGYNNVYEFLMYVYYDDGGLMNYQTFTLDTRKVYERYFDTMSNEWSSITEKKVAHDSNYVHTDNNFSNFQEQRITDLELAIADLAYGG